MHHKSSFFPLKDKWLFLKEKKKIKWYYRYHILLAVPKFWEKSCWGLTTWGGKQKKISGLLRCSALYCAPAAWHRSHDTRGGIKAMQSQQTGHSRKGGRRAASCPFHRENQQRGPRPDAWKKTAAQEAEDSEATSSCNHKPTQMHTVLWEQIA